MCDAIGAVAVSKYKSMIERQLPAYGIRAQIDSWTRTNFHVLIVSNLRSRNNRTGRNHPWHPPRALGPTLDECPTCRPLRGRNCANCLTRLLLSSNKPSAPRTHTILDDHTVDNLATDNTSPRTKIVRPTAARPLEKIHKTHETMATTTSHPILAPTKPEIACSCDMRDMPSVTHRLCVHYCVP